MDWSNEPYVRLYTRETDDDLVLSWDAISLWRALLTKFDRSGLFPTKRGARGIAAATRCPLAQVEAALPELLKDGRLVEVEGGFMSPNFVPAQNATKTDRQRQQDSRDRRRSRNLDQAVTNRDGAVTPRDASVTNVTHYITDPDPDLAAPPSRHEPPDSPEPRLSRGLAISRDPDQIKARRALVSWGLDELNRIRARVAAKFGWKDVRPLPLQGRTETDLLERLRESGADADANLKHVLRIAELEAVAKRTVEYLGGGIFGDASWAKKLSLTEEAAKRAIGTKQGDAPRGLKVRRDDDEPPPLGGGS